MGIQIILFVLAGVAAVWMILNPLTKKRNNNPLPITPIENNNDGVKEVITIDEPVDADPELKIIPIDEEGEMPIKPKPVNCQSAMFNPYPEKYFYYNCCGERFEGEGYQVWEKRSPVSIDSNKEFGGLTLLDVEAEPNC